MTQNSSALPEDFVIDYQIMPAVRQYCEWDYSKSSPLRINYNHLTSTTDYIPIPILAILIAIEEANILGFSSINWLDLGLINRIDSIQCSFCSILTAEITKQDPLAIQLYLDGKDVSIAANRDEDLYWPKITPIFRVSSEVANLMINAINQEKRQKKRAQEKEELNKEIENLRRHNLSHRNLKAELLDGIREYCSNNPVKLIPERLPQKIWLIDLSYYLSIDEKSYQSYDVIEFSDTSLLDNAHSSHHMLIKQLQKIVDIKLNNPSLMLPIHRDKAEKEGILDIAVVPITFEGEPHKAWSVYITKKLALRILKSLKPKSKEPTRAALEEWIKYLIDREIAPTYAKFEDLMINTYFKKDAKYDCEKFNEGPKIREVYCLNDKNRKPRVYFKIENDLGVPTQLDHRSLSSFKDIYQSA